MNKVRRHVIRQIKSPDGTYSFLFCIFVLLLKKWINSLPLKCSGQQTPSTAVTNESCKRDTVAGWARGHTYHTTHLPIYPTNFEIPTPYKNVKLPRHTYPSTHFFTIQWRPINVEHAKPTLEWSMDYNESIYFFYFEVLSRQILVQKLIGLETGPALYKLEVL